MSEEFVIPLEVWDKASTEQRQKWLDEGATVTLEDALKLEARALGEENKMRFTVMFEMYVEDAETPAMAIELAKREINLHGTDCLSGYRAYLAVNQHEEEEA